MVMVCCLLLRLPGGIRSTRLKPAPHGGKMPPSTAGKMPAATWGAVPGRAPQHRDAVPLRAQGDGCGFAALGSLRLANCSFQSELKAPHREKRAVDLEPVTAIQQNSFTPQPSAQGGQARSLGYGRFVTCCPCVDRDSLLSSLLGLLEAEEAHSGRFPLWNDPLRAPGQKHFGPASRSGGGCVELATGSFLFPFKARAVLGQE